MSVSLFSVCLFKFFSQAPLALTSRGRFISDLVFTFPLKIQIVVIPYIQRSGNAPDAPFNDLHFRRQLEEFKDVDKPLYTDILKTWNRHQQFLAPEFSFLSLVSPKVIPAEKAKIAQAISSIERPASLPPAPLRCCVEITADTKLHQLANGVRSYLPFQILNLDTAFLSLPPNEWEQDECFARLRRFAKGFHVTNDVAEHTLQMVTDYNDRITKSEEQRQFLFASVTKQRRENNDLRRGSIQPVAPDAGTPSPTRFQPHRGVK